MYVNEGRLQAAIVRAIKKQYPTAWVFHPVGGPYQETGVPDLVICADGWFVGIEIKNPRPGESQESITSRVTPGQRAQIRAINRAGGTAGVATSVEEALDLLARAEREREERDGHDGHTDLR